MLAAAPSHRAGLSDLRPNRSDACAFMRAIAIGLALRKAAGTPKLYARLLLDFVGSLLWNLRFSHGIAPIGIENSGLQLRNQKLMLGMECCSLNGFRSVLDWEPKPLRVEFAIRLPASHLCRCRKSFERTDNNSPHPSEKSTRVRG